MAASNEALEKLTLVQLDGPPLQVQAMFNPKDIGIDRSVPWSKHPHPAGNTPVLEFTAGENRVMSLELMFDTWEKGLNVYGMYVSRLEEMTLIPAHATSDADKHPPRVRVVWGAGFPRFEGVIESLACKYTMFLSDGTPVRASCTVKIKEVDKVQMKEKMRRSGAR